MWDKLATKRWVFIYLVAMHGPCGHVCARSAIIYLTTSHHANINKAVSPLFLNNNTALTMLSLQMAQTTMSVVWAPKVS